MTYDSAAIDRSSVYDLEDRFSVAAEANVDVQISVVVTLQLFCAYVSVTIDVGVSRVPIRRQPYV
jgi:hypothetical protein